MSAPSDSYDLAIVGLGLIGSAALRHSANAGANVIGIGPTEPEQFNEHTGPFSSHFDSGRVTRRLDIKSEWAILATRSIDQYNEIEQTSGQEFYSDCGSVFARDDASGIAKLTTVASELDVPITVLPADEATATGPCRHFNLPSHFTVVDEPSPAGFIDPRRMLIAQQQAARIAGATINHSEVTSVVTDADGSRHLVTMASGETIVADRVLFTTGAYGTSVYPGGEPVALRVRPEAVTMGEVDPEQLDELADMPSMIYLLEHPELESVYVVPPTLYPNGKTCIKIGPTYQAPGFLENREQMTLWMQTGNHLDHTASPTDPSAAIPVDFQTPNQQWLQEVLTTLLPDVRFVSWESKPCLITETETRLPFIDHIADRISVALGGNGSAAKSADAIGALGAKLALSGSWTDSELTPEPFRARFGAFVAPSSPSSMRRHVPGSNG